jgi:cobalamin-dependent methionine synthase I
MIIVGEKLNSSIKPVKEMIATKNSAEIIKMALAQQDAGANFVDINAGAFLSGEAENLEYMAAALKPSGIPLSIDTPDFEAAKAALKTLGGPGHIINSVTLEKARLENMTALALEYDCSVIALCLPEQGDGDDTEARLRAAEKLVRHLTSKGVKPHKIFLDPTICPLAADGMSGLDALETIKGLKANFPDFHIICGLSNFSFGLPKRGLFNRTFISAAIINGLDAAICDPFDRELAAAICAAEAIAGRDEYCLGFIDKFRSGAIE